MIVTDDGETVWQCNEAMARQGLPLPGETGGKRMYMFDATHTDSYMVAD